VAVTAHATSGLLSDADVSMRRDGSRLVLTGDCDGVPVMSECTVAFDVEVPVDLAADLAVTTTAGEIDLHGMTGDVAVRATAGSVRLADFDGERASIRTTAGEIRVDAGAATRDVDVRSTAGSVHVAIDDTEPLDVDVDTTVGSERVTVRQDPDADRSVTARTTAGEVSVTGR
jgi:DUF4097 and DUF4098 domain-containing protein YvlB